MEVPFAKRYFRNFLLSFVISKPEIVTLDPCTFILLFTPITVHLYGIPSHRQTSY